MYSLAGTVSRFIKGKADLVFNLFCSLIYLLTKCKNWINVFDQGWLTWETRPVWPGNRKYSKIRQYWFSHLGPFAAVYSLLRLLKRFWVEIHISLANKSESRSHMFRMNETKRNESRFAKGGRGEGRTRKVIYCSCARVMQTNLISTVRRPKLLLIFIVIIDQLSPPYRVQNENTRWSSSSCTANHYDDIQILSELWWVFLELRN